MGLSFNQIQQLNIEKKRKGLKNKQLSEAIGCSESLLSKYFKGKCNISAEKEMKLQYMIKNARPNYKLVLERYDVCQ